MKISHNSQVIAWCTVQSKTNALEGTSFCVPKQSRSQSFVPLDQRSENESSRSIRFEITIDNNRILVIRFTAQSQTASMACYGACLKWLLPELSFSDRCSLVPRPVRAIRVTRGGLEPSAIAIFVLGEFSRQAGQVTSHPKSPRTTGNEAATADQGERCSGNDIGPQAENFLGVACAWILQDARTSLLKDFRNTRTSLR